MKDKVHTAEYKKYKKSAKVLQWVFPALLLGQAVLSHFEKDEVLEVYKPVMYVILGLVFIYHMYFMFRYRHEDDNKYKLAIGGIALVGLLTLLLTT